MVCKRSIHPNWPIPAKRAHNLTLMKMLQLYKAGILTSTLSLTSYIPSNSIYLFVLRYVLFWYHYKQYLVTTVIPFLKLNLKGACLKSQGSQSHNKPLQQPIDRQPPALSETVRRDALKISKFLVLDIFRKATKATKDWNKQSQIKRK